MKPLYLATVFVGLVLAQQSTKIDTCGGIHGNIHNCHCAERVEKIRRAAVQTCVDTGDPKAYNACVRQVLAGKDHCSIAERFVPEYDGSDYISPEGDHIKTPMGEFCMRACKPHRCECTELSCDLH
jgi:hypothetical protein